MKKTKLVTSIRKIKGKWAINIKGPYIPSNIYGLDTKEDAQKLCMLLGQAFFNGRYTEFQDNLKRTKKMMDKFGL